MAESGKLKTNPTTAQAQYYQTNYNETSPFSNFTFDKSPLNRVTNVKSPGTSWAAGAGNSSAFDLNNATDQVRQFQIGYSSGSLPTSTGVYPSNSLLKTQHTDENGKQVIEYTNSQGQVVLTKSQMDDNPANAYDGWICIYSIYDDFGQLRCRIQPEAVKWLSTNGWSFSGTDGSTVMDEWCFRYEYDEKGRNILKKAPGAKALNMIYDIRDRPVFLQDGNQAAKTPAEWTVNLYDDLDRIIITLLYRTNETREQLQDKTHAESTLVLHNPDQPVKDLIVQDRSIDQPPYKAQQSIEFTPGFESTAGDDFVAEIDPNFAQPSTVTALAFNNVILPDLNNPSISTILKYHFYDDYSFTSVKAFDNQFTNAVAYPSGQDIIPIAASQRTTGFPTGSMVRVLGTNTFLATSVYYDEKGRLIQTLEENIQSGKDITTLQYHFDGRLLSSHKKHTTASSGYTSFGILTKNIFDKIGRITSIQKKYGDNAFKTIAAYTLDDVGRLNTKQLSPDFLSPNGGAGGGLESLSYSYNIHNNITGINKDYALKTPGKYGKWDNFLGLYLGFDNKDGIFNTARLDGTVTGLLWTTQGDDAQRKYDYTYDNVGRITSATFNEKGTTGGTWTNSKMDFSSTGTNGKITYDLHGNLQNMIQKGVLPGGTTPVNIDDLSYTYASLTTN